MNTHQIVGTGSHRVIAVHGWFGSASGWGPLTKILDRDKFTYAFMDARGYGGMKGSAGPFTVEQMADDVVALADGLGWDKFDL
ncbi:MAG: alpha/beta fold hydrolase, partial [Rhodoferax sp.]